MTVVVVPYRDDWPELFRLEAARLQSALAPWLTGPVEHVGSTAVPGLVAKPVLDMLAPVDDHEAAHEAIAVLADLGYRHEDHRPDEALWFHDEDDAGTRRHQLHLTRPDSALWRERLAFREALRQDPDARAAYATLKTRLAEQHGDLEGYTGAKRAFVAGVLRSRGVRLDDGPS